MKHNPYMPCKTCKGKGEVKYRTCRECNGAGSIRVPRVKVLSRCDGSGESPRGPAVWGTCGACGGEGCPLHAKAKPDQITRKSINSMRKRHVHGYSDTVSHPLLTYLGFIVGLTCLCLGFAGLLVNAS